jgi:hypothetical protein
MAPSGKKSLAALSLPFLLMGCEGSATHSTQAQAQALAATSSAKVSPDSAPPQASGLFQTGSGSKRIVNYPVIGETVSTVPATGKNSTRVRHGFFPSPALPTPKSKG